MPLSTVRPRRRALRVAASLGVAWLCAIQSWAQTPAVQLTAAEVRALLTAAGQSLSDPTLAVAVVDRGGRILGVYSRVSVQTFIPDVAVSVARTGAFFSHDQAPLSSRTVRALSGVHFPANVPNSPVSELYGIENTNRGCQIDPVDSQPLPRARAISGSLLPGVPSGDVCRPSDTRGCSKGGPIVVTSGGQTITNFNVGLTTGKADLLDDNHARPLQATVQPGGVGLYRNGRMVGGIGVAGVSEARAEYAAFRAAFAGAPGISALPVNPLPPPGAVFVDGLRLPFFASCVNVACVERALSQLPPGASPGSYSTAQELFSPRAGLPDASGYLIPPRASTIAGGLTAADVQRMIEQAIASADKTRAAIRLPLGSTTKMIISVSDEGGNILGAFRMADATIFSFDVALTKARNAYYFSTRDGYDVLRTVATNAGYRWEPAPPSGQGWAVTNRTLSFAGQPLFPPGIDLDPPVFRGPWFDIFTYDSLNPCTEGPGATRGGNRQYLNQSGIVWFPGSAPVFKGGRLVGGIGVSGDGVGQDDYVTAMAVVGFEAPAELRVDRSMMILPDGTNVRMPYFKFPRNPEIK